MHIMEGFLPLQWCIVWWIMALPCLILGMYQLKKVLATDREASTLTWGNRGIHLHPVILKTPFGHWQLFTSNRNRAFNNIIRTLDYLSCLRNRTPVPEPVPCPRGAFRSWSQYRLHGYRWTSWLGIRYTGCSGTLP